MTKSEDVKKNEVVKKQEQLPATPATNKSVFGAYGEAANTRPFEGELLVFSKGDFLLGKEKREISPGTQVQVFMPGLTIGWQRWDNNKPTSHQVGLLIDNYQPPPRSALGDLDKSLWSLNDDGEPKDPWQYSNFLPMKNGGSDLWTFTTSSKGGLNAIAALCKDFDRWMRTHPNKNPLVALGVDSYQHPVREYGRIKIPTLTIVGEGDEYQPASPPGPVTPSAVSAV